MLPLLQLEADTVWMVMTSKYDYIDDNDSKDAPKATAPNELLATVA